MTVQRPQFTCVTPSVTKPCFFCIPGGKCLERERIAAVAAKRKEAASREHQ